MDALDGLRRRLHRLESDPGMRKGRLVDSLLRDTSIRWDAIFTALAWKGRHRHKNRWRRVLIGTVMRRVFPRGGNRRGAIAPAAPAPPAPETADEFGADVSADETWNRFRASFPVLALYRSGWSPHSCVATQRPRDPVEWAALWSDDAPRVSLRAVARALQWPPEVVGAGVLPLIGPLAARLWPAHPWEEWLAGTGEAGGDAGPACQRAAVPFVRRAAYLLHGFVLGGCSPVAVWGAIGLPDRDRSSRCV